ncbi:hypothetical protein LUZ60_006524 [Juncus effusus]|nr:hypothetical protein LUZ60_006524 [Juncus effusus]
MAISLNLFKKTIFTIILLLISSPAVRSDEVNDMLPQYGLLKGLLPNSVESYSLSDDGSFEVNLKSTCYVQFSSNLVYYERTIKGKLSYGAISDLSGIQAKKLFIWVSVTAIVAHSDKDEIEFQVGVISQNLPESEFESIPSCKSCVSCRGAAGIPPNAGLLSSS